MLYELKKAENIITCGMTGSGSTCFGIFNNIEDIKIFSKNRKTKHNVNTGNLF